MSTITDNNQRFLYPVAQINDKGRIRQDYGDIDELAESIKTLGLLQPIVVKLDGTLIAGGRRLRAMRKLGWTDAPVTYFEVADEVTLRVLEVEENVRRKPMSWQERVLAIDDVDKRQSLTKALKSEKWTQQATGELLGMSSANVSYAIQLAKLIRIGDKEIMKCEKLWDAIGLLTKRGAEESNKLLAKMTLPAMDIGAARKMLTDANLAGGDDIFTPVASAPSAGGVQALTDDGEIPGSAVPTEAIEIPLSRMVILGDSLEVIKQIPNDSIDHTITDWPFGNDMANLQQTNTGMDVSSTAVEHDVATVRKLQLALIPELFRVIKDGGFFASFIDLSMRPDELKHLLDVVTVLDNVGFKIQAWPLIWHKTHRCMNQQALINFTKDYEPVIICRKGNANLLTPQATSIYMGATDEGTRALQHPFAKPPKLWQWLYSAVAHKGQLVLDPFAGVGSSTLAAIEYGLQPLAIEINEKFHAACVVNVSEHYRRTLKNVKFT